MPGGARKLAHAWNYLAIMSEIDEVCVCVQLEYHCGSWYLVSHEHSGTKLLFISCEVYIPEQLFLSPGQITHSTHKTCCLVAIMTVVLHLPRLPGCSLLREAYQALNRWLTCANYTYLVWHSDSLRWLIVTECEGGVFVYISCVLSYREWHGGGALTQKLPMRAQRWVRKWTKWDLFTERDWGKRDLNITKIRGLKDLWNIQLDQIYDCGHYPN